MVTVDDFDKALIDGPVPKGTPLSADIGLLLCLRFALLMERNGFPNSMFTTNLHQLVCRYDLLLGST